MEKAYPKLFYYHQAAKGGHFAAWEQPQILRKNFDPHFDRFDKEGANESFVLIGLQIPPFLFACTILPIASGHAQTNQSNYKEGNMAKTTEHAFCKGDTFTGLRDSTSCRLRGD